MWPASQEVRKVAKEPQNTWRVSRRSLHFRGPREDDNPFWVYVGLSPNLTRRTCCLFLFVCPIPVVKIASQGSLALSQLTKRAPHSCRTLYLTWLHMVVLRLRWTISLLMPNLARRRLRSIHGLQGRSKVPGRAILDLTIQLQK